MTDQKQPIIMWFRQDLRLTDNPALNAASETGHPILPVYILDDENSSDYAMGAASRWWLHQSLTSLNNSLNGHMVFAKGDAQAVLEKLVKDTNAHGLYWNRCYEPWRIERDTAIKESFAHGDMDVQSFNGSLLFEPHRALKSDGTPYRVFTPFYKRGCLENNPEPRESLGTPQDLNLFTHNTAPLDDLSLMPSIKWYEHMDEEWNVGEEGAQDRLTNFLEHGLDGYKEGRNIPSEAHVSRLSPHLHFGEISPYQIWHEAKAATVAQNCEKDGAHFLSEIGWREFSHSLLYHFPTLPKDNLQEKFNAFPWRDDPDALKRWQTGQTGYPIVDAGMRELWQTGYMHNRVRMIVGSFLVKNLMLHWHHGERWFWDTLVDADLANNSAGWQWIAGCGADAAPYFRIFNPVTQGQKFDKDGAYVRRFVPELSKMPDKHLHAPWDAPRQVLDYAGVELGKTYPKPIVDLKESRERALAAFKSISNS